jgi:hypothetical protein
MVERNEVDQMSKFMAALGGQTEFGATDGVPTAPRPLTGDTAEMKLILERFHAAADKIVTEAPRDRELREALMTEATVSGSRIGAWEIRMHANGKRKLYDVVNVLSGDALAVDLSLYEAAHGLVRILNDGGRINSYGAIELLRAEQEYAGRVQDMVVYKHRLTSNPNSPRSIVLEARYGDAKRRAVSARDRVCKLAERY